MPGWCGSWPGLAGNALMSTRPAVLSTGLGYQFYTVGAGMLPGWVLSL